MLVIAVIALAIRLPKFDPARSNWDLWIAGVLVLLYSVWALAGLFFARTCPSCGQNDLVRVTLVPFGMHYLKCRSCGQRMQRSPLSGRTWDASGPEDDRFFRPKDRPVMTWGDDPHIAPIDTPQTRTVAGLLRGKLHREAEAPEPIEIAPGERGWVETGDSAPARPSIAAPPPRRGVKRSVAEALFRSWDAIRWSRNSPR